MTRTITLTQNVHISGAVSAAGTTIAMSDGEAADLVTRKCATYVTDPMGGSRTGEANFSLDASGAVTGLVGPDGSLMMQFVDVGGASAGTNVEV